MLLWRRVSAIPFEKGCPGTFSRSLEWSTRTEIFGKEISLFVSFDCDSLARSEEKKKVGKENFGGGVLCCLNG